MRFIFLLFLLHISALGFSQTNDLAIGQWRSHLPHTSGWYVTQSDAAIFYATEFSILRLDKQDGSVQFISTVNGLSQTGIRLIKYHPGLETLIIVYNDSAIDLWQDGKVTTLNQIPNFENFVGEKTVFDVFIENDSMIYLGANYGLSRLNVKKQEFAATTFTGIAVNDVVVFDGQVYASTTEGIYTISTSFRTPEDFSRWVLLSADQGFPLDYSTREMTIYNGQLYLDIDHSIYRLDGDGKAELVYDAGDLRMVYMTSEGNHVLAGYRCNGGDCTEDQVIFLDESSSVRQLPGGCLGNLQYGIETPEGSVYLADRFRGFRFLNQKGDPACNILNFNSPWNENNYGITIYNDMVWVAAGGVDQTFSNRFSPSGFSSLIDGQWTNYNPSNWEALRGENKNFSEGGDDLLDFLDIAIHPGNGLVYAGSFYEGLIEFDFETMTLYNEKNSSLQNAVGDDLRTRVSGLDFDEDNNLWISNHAAERPVSVLTNTGEWQNFRLSCNRTELHQIEVDPNGFKWMIEGTNQAGVVVFDEGDPSTESDDRCKVFTENNSNLPTNQTNCLAIDLDGSVWVGTSAGILIFECGMAAFEDICVGSLRGFEEGGFVEPLLKTQDVKTIAIDGANRKWIGTLDGVFVLSPNGDEEVFRFTTENSPLLDNSIIDIAINPSNGEAFIGTNKGIISYRSDAIAANRFHESTLKVFPNPVYPDYRGPITIQGVTRDATLKITDMSGRLVYELESQGGQAVWDGTDYTGRRVNSGVYLVYSATNSLFNSSNTKDTGVAKIVFVR